MKHIRLYVMIVVQQLFEPISCANQKSQLCNDCFRRFQEIISELNTISTVSFFLKKENKQNRNIEILNDKLSNICFIEQVLNETKI